MVFLRTSEKTFLDEEEGKIRNQKRQIRKSRIIKILLGTAAIISVGFMLFAFVQKITAERQIILAETRRVQAEKEKIKSDSSTVAAIRKQQLADSNFVIARQNEATALLQREKALIEQNKAERDAAEAKRQEEIAMIQSDSAKSVGIRAEQNTVIATEQKNNALRLRMISIAKSMSVRSIQFQGQKDLQTLLAYQAYLFNRKNNGAENDADVYNGLYNVARQYGNTNFKTFKGHKGEIKSIAFVPGRKEFYTSGNDGQILKWSTEGQNQAYQVIYSGADIIEVLAVSPDASWLACGSDNASIRMIPLKGNNIQYELTDHKGKIKSLFFSYDGKSLYSASLDGKVLQWDLTTRTSKDLTTGEMQITSIDISSNGKYLAGINTVGNVIVWDPENKSDIFSIETAGKNIKVIRFKPDENILALGDGTGNVELWDISTRRKISEVRAHTAQVNDIQFNPSLKQMATASNDKTLKIFNISDNTDLTEPPVILSDNEGFVLVMEFSPDGQLLVSGTYEGTQNLVSRPAHVDNMVNDICTLVARNMTLDEWNAYVARDIPFEPTCAEKGYNIKVNVIR
jgi:WD40 repeat protein